MEDIAISVQGVGKRYRLGYEARKYKALRDVVAGKLRSLFRRSRQDDGAGPETFWALDDVSFDIKRGEVVGIIGRNGAGKSTMLKVLSRITEPTRGRVEIRGRVGSLLEVGTGFHPELTGRENTFMNGAILGMTRGEIERKFDQIVSFAEIERFVDTPVKHYSSGMYMRLAFSVAAHLEPEILIVDEVLAVGDSTFQKKCLGKMKDVSQEGRTVILVSHNMTAVRTLCTRGVWLHKGKLQMEGGAQEVVSQYLKSMSASSAHMQWDDPATAPGTSEVRLNRIAVTAAGRTDEDFTVATPLTLEVRYWNLGVAQPLNVSVEVYNTEEVCVFSSFDKPVVYPRGLLRARCEIPAHLLNDAMYRFRVLIVRDANSIIYAHEGVTIEVNDVPREVAYFGKWVGTVRPTLQWSSDVVEAESEVLAGGARV